MGKELMKKLLLLMVVPLLAAPVLAADQAATATAQVCTAVKDRTPEGVADRFPASVGELYCFSRLTNVTDKVVHVWFYADKEVFRIELPVKASPWRTWSAKRILPSMTGAWRIEVQDATGKVLASSAFTVE
jgi:hypothetical protein